jgi:multiple sugar transport system permease protein
MENNIFIEKTLAVFKFLILTIYALFVVFPFAWIFITSLKASQGEIYRFPISYFPDNPSITNYIKIFSMGNFGTYIFNSLLVSIVAGSAAVFIGILGGYVIARYNFKLKGLALFIFLFTQMIPMFIMLAPLYQMLGKAGMVNKLYTLIILYTNMMIPFSLVTLRGFFQGIPVSLEEAAMIDGCGRLKALFAVIIPIMLPGIASTFIFAFVNCWNELFTAVIFIDVDQFKTIPVALNSFILKYDIEWGPLTAGTVISILPTIFLFSYAQKYMASGLTNGAVKG